MNSGCGDARPPQLPSSPEALTGPVLVIGAGGMLGRAWCELLLATGIEHTSTSTDQLNLTQPDRIASVVDGRFRIVINCAAYTDVDRAESDGDTALAVNGTGVGYLAQRCRDVGCLLVHYSTDYVFAGHASMPYTTDHPRDPINAYGRSKAAGEVAIEASGCRYLIIRTSWLYAPWSNNFIRTIIDRSRQQPSLRVVDDQRGRPTSCPHLAAASLRLVEHQAHGCFHVTDGGACSWFEFACEIVRLAGVDCVVQPCGSDAYPRAALRPSYSVLNLSKTEALIGPMPYWKDNLAKVMRQWQTVTL